MPEQAQDQQFLSLGFIKIEDDEGLRYEKGVRDSFIYVYQDDPSKHDLWFITTEAGYFDGPFSIDEVIKELKDFFI